MIFLFHGNNLVTSREAFLQLQRQYAAAAKSDLAAAIFSLSSNATLPQFQEVCEPGALFGGVRLIIMEIPLKEAVRRPAALINDASFPDYLKNKPESTHVALWFDEELPARHPLLQALKGERAARIFCANLAPPNVFSFLEALANRRREEALRKFCYWQKAGINNIYLLTMVAWQVRRLLAFFYGIPLGKVAPFAQAKLTRQVKNFSEDELLSFYDRLYDLDTRGKSSEADLSCGLFRLVEEITR